MNFHFSQTLALATFGIGLTLTAWQSSAQLKPKSAIVSEIKNYKSWREVTQRPVEMDPRVAMMCVAPSLVSRSTAPPTIRGTRGPHQKKYIRVYVNGLGEEPMLERKPRFAVGSVIVKEKLPLLKNQKTVKPPKISAKPELLTVMIKREKGYDAANGDWEYLVTDGVGKQTGERGKLETCQGCHRPFAKTDYIVRSYLPREIEKSLRDEAAPQKIREDGSRNAP